MAEPAPPVLSPPAPRTEQMFPTLTPAQAARIAAHGSVRPIRSGEVLVEAGQQSVPFYLVTAGQIEIVQPSGTVETPVALHGPGQFTGEVNMLSARRSLVRARVIEPGEVIELDHSQLQSSKPVFPECSRSATSGAAISSVWHQPSEKDRSRSPSSTRCSTSKGTTMASGICSHINAITEVKQAKHHECEECVKIGAQWVHLRTCQECGTTLCCDSSPNRHASKHARARSHPVVASAEPGEQWLYCFPDDAFVEY